MLQLLSTQQQQPFISRAVTGSLRNAIGWDGTRGGGVKVRVANVCLSDDCHATQSLMMRPKIGYDKSKSATLDYLV